MVYRVPKTAIGAKTASCLHSQRRLLCLGSDCNEANQFDVEDSLDAHMLGSLKPVATSLLRLVEFQLLSQFSPCSIFKYCGLFSCDCRFVLSSAEVISVF